MTILISAGIGALLFLCAFLGFRQGLRLGMQTAKGRVPSKIDISTVKQKIDEKKQQQLQADILKGYQNMMDYTGEPKEGV